jgi:predicted secreted protein/putative hemolysin
MKRMLILTLVVALVVLMVSIISTTPSVQARPNAQATATPDAMMNHDMDAAAAKYCAEKGGTVTTRYPAYNTNAPQTQWLKLAGSRDFCTFLAPADDSGFQSQISIALDTLYADMPTLAVLAYLEPVALPPFTGANPSTLYCEKLGGTDIWGGQNNAAGGGWVTDAPESKTNFQIVGMCMFPDGSAIDAWGLTYKANGVVRGTDLSKVVKYQPTQLPNVFTGAASASQAAEGDVDKTLTGKDNGSKVTLKTGDVLSIALDSNPSTGYSWKVSQNDAKVLLPLGEPQFSMGGKEPMPGVGGTQTFQFKALAKGQTPLTLVYVRPWETNVTPTPNDTFTVTVTVE